MIKIAEVVEELVLKSPYLSDAVADRLINVSELARKLRPEIQDRLMKPVQQSAIAMAIRRLEVHSKKKTVQKKLCLKNITVRSQLIEITFENSQTLPSVLEGLVSKLSKHTNQFFTITQGVFETAVIAHEDQKNRIESLTQKEKQVHIEEHISSITLLLPDENVDTPGVYYTVLKALAWEGINLIDVVSTYRELTILVSSRDIQRAFQVVERL